MPISRDAPIGILGAGRLGSSLAAALLKHGYNLTAVGSHQPDSAARLAAAVGGVESISEPREIVRRADVIFLAIPDSLIHSVALQLPWRNEQAVVHCSGALGLDALQPVTDARAAPGCFHPIQSFPNRAPEPERFRDITIGYEGSPPLDTFLRTLAGDLGATPLSLAGVDRALYHTGAVLASNDVVALMAAASRAWELAGLPLETARTALAPLIRSAVENLAEQPLERALTGPVARGDVATVAAHLSALRSQPELHHLYVALARQLLRLPLNLRPATLAQFHELLSNPEDANGPDSPR